MSVRELAVVLAVVCASILVVPVAAGAQQHRPATAVSSLQKVPVSGTPTTKKFIGQFAVDRFVSRSGKTFAIGTLTENPAIAARQEVKTCPYR